MKPYVYIIQNKDRTHWYVGFRKANNKLAHEDTEYWGSSDYLDELIAQTGKDQWTKTIIKEFDTWQEAKAHEDELLELMWDWDGRVNKARNGFVDMRDPEVKAAHQKAMASPEYIANHKAGCLKKAQDPVYRANHKAACAIANRKRAKPFIATKIDTGEEFYCESGRCDQAKALNLNPGAVFSWLRGTYPCPNYKGFTFRYA